MPRRVPVKTGRPRTEPTEKDVANIETWASEGCGPIEIARALGVSKDTLMRWRKDHRNVAEALEAGKEAEHKALLSKVVEMARDGHIVALLFLLKCRHGYREGDQTDNGGRAQINITLPAAMPLDQFITIQNERHTGTDPIPNATSIPTGRR